MSKKEEFNEKLIEDFVKTTHKDYRGIIEIGHSGNKNISNMVQDLGIVNIKEEYTIIAWGVSCGNLFNLIDKGKVNCRILLAEKDLIEKEKSIKHLVVTEKLFTIDYSVLQKYLTDFDFLAVSPITHKIQEIEIDETINVDNEEIIISNISIVKCNIYFLQ